MRSKAAKILFYCIGILLVSGTVASAGESEPVSAPRKASFKHGFGQVLYGTFLEFPKTTLDATLKGPPVIGTLVGAIGGIKQGLEKIILGMAEMNDAFTP